MIRTVVLLLLTCTLTFAQSPIPQGAKLEKLKSGFLQPEGPVWKDGEGILFSDIKANKIYLWSPKDSTLTTYLSPSDSSNGLTYDHEGRLILTQMRLRRVAIQDSDGTITPIVSTYDGKKFNSPNDLVVKSDGSIFFTDPDFNIPFPYTSELGFSGIYRISSTGNVQLLNDEFDKPNGICFSPDEKKLYVNESPQSKIYVWDVVDDSTITNKKLFYSIPAFGYSDGMKVDPEGNLYCTGPTGVWIISPTGTFLDKIAMNENPSNCNWGDADRKTLYITAGKSLYRIRLAQEATAVDEQQGLLNDMKYELYDNYPNPFNPETVIEYRLPVSSNVTLKIFDTLGREVTTLVNEIQVAGKHEVKFNAVDLTSGTYFYQLKAGEFVQTRKSVLMK